MSDQAQAVPHRYDVAHVIGHISVRARSVREMFYEEHFRKIEEEFPNFSFYAAMSEPQPEDNWTGPTGFIHSVVLKEYLQNHDDPTEIE